MKKLMSHSFKNINFVLAIMIFIFIPNESYSANNIEFLSKSAIKNLQSSVFEVVIPKKENKDIKYAKKLPFQNLSFKERNEKFYSIGTAFFINKKELMSAAHVFNLHFFSQFTDFYIRDKNGVIYKINKINKYSTVRDMVVFELDSYPKSYTPLNFSNKTEIGDTVFSVGNAQGEGVSFRAGQVASFTLESEFGKWKDIRFTSPASPGNSGGPLVNINGEVVGLIVKRNISENHNIAVPIKEVLKLNNHAEFFVRNNSLYLNQEDNTIVRDWKSSFKLPLKTQVLAKKAQNAYGDFYEKLGHDLTGKFENEFYPNGERFRVYLREQKFIREFGVLTSDSGFNKWSVKNYYSKKVSLSKNQKISLSRSEISTFQLVIDKPVDMKLSSFLEDQKILMDNILVGLPLSRQIGVEKIKITSLGKPESTERWQDKLGRNWISTLWFMPHQNTFVYSHCLPYPKGQICNLDIKSSYELTFGYLENIKESASEIVIGYQGSISDWVEYLALDEKYLPKIFQGSKISLVNNTFKVKFSDYSINLNSSEISNKSDVHLHLGYSNTQLLKEHLLLFEVFPRKGVDSHYRVQEYFEPSSFNSDSSKSTWEDLKLKKGDFTGKIVNKSKNFVIKNIVVKEGKNTKKDFDIDSKIVIGCYQSSLAENFKSKCDEFTRSVSMNN